MVSSLPSTMATCPTWTTPATGAGGWAPARAAGRRNNRAAATVGEKRIVGPLLTLNRGAGARGHGPAHLQPRQESAGGVAQGAVRRIDQVDLPLHLQLLHPDLAQRPLA